tara:strand:+ start:1448 stop:1663 length:216 start_codon:yes stop_codon:yes gene_type:complete
LAKAEVLWQRGNYALNDFGYLANISWLKSLSHKDAIDVREACGSLQYTILKQEFLLTVQANRFDSCGYRSL